MLTLVPLTVAAAAIGVPCRTLRTHINRGKVASTKIGYGVFIDIEELRRYARDEHLEITTGKVFLFSHPTPQ